MSLYLQPGILQYENLVLGLQSTGAEKFQDKYPLLVRGSKGQSIQEYHDIQNGPTAYLGTSTPGFPNFYQLCGM